MPFCVECSKLLFFGAGKAKDVVKHLFRGRFYCEADLAIVKKRVEMEAKLKEFKIPIKRPATGAILPGTPLGFREGWLTPRSPFSKERIRMPESAKSSLPGFAGQTNLIQVTEKESDSDRNTRELGA